MRTGTLEFLLMTKRKLGLKNSGNRVLYTEYNVIYMYMKYKDLNYSGEFDYVYGSAR